MGSQAVAKTPSRMQVRAVFLSFMQSATNEPELYLPPLVSKRDWMCSSLSAALIKLVPNLVFLFFLMARHRYYVVFVQVGPFHAIDQIHQLGCFFMPASFPIEPRHTRQFKDCLLDIIIFHRYCFRLGCRATRSSPI